MGGKPRPPRVTKRLEELLRWCAEDPAEHSIDMDGKDAKALLALIEKAKP